VSYDTVDLFSFFFLPLVCFSAFRSFHLYSFHLKLSLHLYFLVTLTPRVCRAGRPVSGEDGILEVEVSVGLRPHMPTHLFGPNFS
jgi:hypothetical protein